MQIGGFAPWRLGICKVRLASKLCHARSCHPVLTQVKFVAWIDTASKYMLIGQVRFLSIAIALSKRSGCLDEVLLHRLGQSSLLVLLEGIDGTVVKIQPC